jgi:uncharacterized protein (DUF362 family)
MTKKKLVRFVFSVIGILSLISLSSAGMVARLGRDLTGAGNVTPGKTALVGFTCLEREPTDEEVRAMVDEVIFQTLGPEGLASVCKPGDRVVIKVNLVGPHRGGSKEKGLSIITDPRIVRYVAEMVREIIGWDDPADLVVTDTTFYKYSDPSLKSEPTSFYYARLERTGNNRVDPEDFCYDCNADGILDGTSGARLVNSDSWDMDHRFLTEVREPTLGLTKVYLPDYLRTKEQSGGELPYCDVLIGLPIFKSHGFVGMTGALKLHYGLRYLWPSGNETGKTNHSGYGWGTGNQQLLLDYLCAQQKARPYDFVIMDALTGNRRGPINISVENFEVPADYIKSHAVLASTDPAAIDTVETLLAGYDPASVRLLATAAADGLGEIRPEYITVAGFDRFVKHKQYLFRIYNKKSRDGRKAGSWPFYNGWGKARVLSDFEAPAIVEWTQTAVDSQVCTFSYRIEEKGDVKTGLARIDFLVDGTLFTSVRDPESSGQLHMDLSPFKGTRVQCRIAVWDKALNCTVSDSVVADLK